MATFVPLYFNVDASGFAYPTPGTTSDTMQIGKIAASGVAGVAFDAGNTLISNVQDPSSNLDAANKQWTLAEIQTYLTGLSWKNAVKAATTAALADPYTYANGTLGVGATLTRTGNGAFPTVDGVSLVAGSIDTGDRVLIKNETGGNQPYNGIYVLTQQGSGALPWILTRAKDDDEAAEMVAATVAVGDEGTANKDTSWIQVTHAPITMGTSNIVWNAGPSVTAYTAGAGLQLASSIFSVKNGDGIEVTSNSASTNVRLDGTAPGLQFTGVAGSGALQVKINGTTLALTNSGLSVDHAADYQTTRTTDGTGVTKGAGVYYSANGVVGNGDGSNIAKVGVIGVARATVGPSASVQLGQNGDIITGILPADGHVAGTPYYMGHSGTPILAGALAGSDRVIRLGYAVASGAASDLEVSIQDMGKKP